MSTIYFVFEGVKESCLADCDPFLCRSSSSILLAEKRPILVPKSAEHLDQRIQTFESILTLFALLIVLIDHLEEYL